MFHPYAVLLLFALVPANNGHFVKIPGLSKVIEESIDLVLELNETACNDSLPYNASLVRYPEHHDYISIHKDIKFWSSDAVRSGVAAVLKFAIPGKPGLTVGDVLNYYTNSRTLDCWAYLWGGSIRDQYTQSPVNDADIEFSCNSSIVYDACVQKWTKEYCRLTSHNTTIIGQYPNPKDIDAVDWSRGMLAKMTDLEYTANSLGYDLNEDRVVVDISGMAKDDVCDRVIRIPTEHYKWMAWATPVKIYRYWKLRSKGFHKADTLTQNFVTKLVRSYPTSTLKYYACHIYFDGTYSKTDQKCAVPDCSTAYKMFAKFKPYLEDDLGSYWYTVSRALDAMMSACSTVPPVQHNTTTATPPTTTSGSGRYWLGSSILLLLPFARFLVTAGV